MPTYAYFCEPCEVEFEESFTTISAAADYVNSFACPVCNHLAQRRLSAVSFNFKGGVRGLSGTHGQSGVHDLDYPTLDKAVARSSEKRWAKINETTEAVNKVRQDTGSHAVTMNESGKLIPTEKSVLEKRSQVIGAFNASKKP